jgi:hypothetical protein
MNRLRHLLSSSLRIVVIVLVVVESRPSLLSAEYMSYLFGYLFISVGSAFYCLK